MLFNMVFSTVLSILDASIGTGALLSGIFVLAAIIPAFAVGARRLHDTGKSGWLQLLVLIPLIGYIILLIFYVQDSASGENKYGPNPKEN